ncbi:helix-turn-helix domain-containing protein [Paenibacillus cremeus]|uniref:AraC family transcriptional regulator n=1 Tax=Paenibacillus cremeus TaxID=2163881 RepID=A0A559KGI5_9BACL|nr:helix-turn-helix domain-containing protein [Paenibacillus cremeus]TVY11239.1 AraC family transcriptional regulator [Paenibacillus cremeus]
METAEIVQRAIDFIEKHLDEPLDLEQIAEAAAMSLPNLYRLFYAMTGHPIKEYIRKRRLSEAARFLRQTDLSAMDIGFRCGFDTYQAFLKSFKRSTGLTPGIYRQAELIFSFERLQLNERVSYLEEKEISERYPDVKVIRLAPQPGIGYLHAAVQEEGGEDLALQRIRELLADSGIDARELRLFGWNVDLRGSLRPYGYQVVAVTESCRQIQAALQTIELSGGLYAMTRTPAGSGPEIVAAWNRLLSEWLPRSTFELGDHGFLEEYQQYGGQISRLKLYLPVKRRPALEPIAVVEQPSVSVVTFRAEGIDCVSKADEASTEWLTSNGFAGDRRLQVYMSCSYGNSSDELSMYEVHIALPEGYVPLQVDAHRMNLLEGGLYACMETGAYGSMAGVLERMYRWLGTTADYELDEERTWYAHYHCVVNDFDRSVSVQCYVPIVAR